MFMDDATRIKRKDKTAMKESTKAKNEETIKELEEALKEKASQNPEYLVSASPIAMQLWFPYALSGYVKDTWGISG